MWRLLLSLIDWVVKRIQYKGRIEDKLDAVISSQTEAEKRLLRLEIIEAVRRCDNTTVYHLYDEYKALGGDSWMDDMFLQWATKQKDI